MQVVCGVVAVTSSGVSGSAGGASRDRVVNSERARAALGARYCGKEWRDTAEFFSRNVRDARGREVYEGSPVGAGGDGEKCVCVDRAFPVAVRACVPLVKKGPSLSAL